MHKTIDPAILYFGTPVVLVSTLNEDGTPNLAPMSSAWWLRKSCMLGFDPTSKTPENLLRTGECVLNLPSADLVERVDRLACLTGANPVPHRKASWGYLYEADKFGVAGLTATPSDEVLAPRVAECAVQLEAILEAAHPFGAGAGSTAAPIQALEVRIVRVHVDELLLAEGSENRIDPRKWRPLVMSFRQFFGLGDLLHSSRLAQFPEDGFRPQKSPGSGRQAEGLPQGDRR